MLTIHMHHLIFHSFHGIFEEEKILGNDFEVNVDVSIDGQERISTLGQSVDYVQLYSIIKSVMEEPTPLLETVVYDLAERVRLFDEKIKSVHINIKKLHPPIGSFQGAVSISFNQTF